MGCTMYCMSIFYVGIEHTRHSMKEDRKPRKTLSDQSLLLGRTLPLDISLLRNGKLQTLALGQRHPRFDTLTNDENIGNTEMRLENLLGEGEIGHLPSGKSPVQGIPDVHNIETTNVFLAMCDNTSTTHVTATCDHNNVAGIELDEVGDLVLLDVKLDGVIDTDEGVGITDCSAVVSNNVGYAAGTKSNLADLEELVGSLLGGDTVDGETALNIVEEAEVFARLLDADNI